MNKKTSWDWYAVKIIKHITVSRQPDEKLIDEFYVDDGKQDFEESLMLVKAQSFDHAYKIAERKSQADSSPYPNMYGQQVEWKYVAAVDCFLILDDLKSGAELYSCFHSTLENVSEEEFINKWFSPQEGCRKARHL